jgi:hypothetical protein
MDTTTGKERFAHDGNTGPVEAVAFAPDSRTVATGGERLRLWDATTGKERALAGDVPPAGSVAFSPDGKTLLSGGSDQVIRLWDAGAGKELRKFTGECGEVEFLSFLPGGKNALSMSQHRTYRFATNTRQERELQVRIWDVLESKQTRSVGNVMMNRAALSADGRLLATGMNGIQAWDVPTGKQLGQLESDTYLIYALALSPDGRRLAASFFNQKKHGSDMALWETASGKAITHLKGVLEQAPQAVSLAMSDSLLASGGAWGLIRLWDMETGQEVRQLKGHQGAVLSLAFSADGKQLVSGSCDTTALVWDVRNVLPAPTATTLKPEKLRELWIDLAGEAPQAVQAIGLLARAPDQAVPFLREQLQTGLVPEQQQIAKLIALLDDDEFAVREKATRELTGFGKRAEPALRRALENNPSLETRRRITRLLPTLVSDTWPPSDVLRILRSIEVLERVGTEEARAIIERLGKDSSDSWTPAETKAALERLSRRAKIPR